MVAAVVLINAARDEIPQAAQAAADLDGVAEVYSVSGAWDLVAIVRVSEWERIADVVTEGIAKLDGVQRTHTLIAFRVYSKEDIARAYDMFE